MSCLLDSYDQITNPAPDSSDRLFFKGGFLVTDVVNPSINTFIFSGPVGFRSNDDSMDIMSEIDLTFDATVEGIGGLHPDHFPAIAETEYAIRIIGDITGANPPRLDAYQTSLGDPGLYPGYQKSRIVFKYVTSLAISTHNKTIAVHGSKYLVYLDINATTARILANGADDTPTVIDLSRLVPTGLPCRVRLKNAFRIGNGGVVGINSLDISSNNGGQLSNLQENRMFMPQVSTNTMIDKFDWTECSPLSEILYQITDPLTDRVNVHVFGYERTIGGDD